MCAHHSKHQIFKINTPMIYAVMIILGIISGMSDLPLLKSFGLLISDIFIKIFKCISLPIISLSLIVTLSGFRSEENMQSLWQRAMRYTLSTTFVAAFLSFLLYVLIRPEMVHVATTQVNLPTNQFNYFEHLSNLIPSTVFAPFIEHQVMSVLFLSIIIGIAIRHIPDKDAQTTITNFFRGAHGLFMVITNWVIKIIPIGLFGFITTSVVQLRSGTAIKGIGQYLLVIILANLIQGLVILPLWLRSHGIKPYKALKSMLPALSLAFFSKSSVGSLPVTMETAEKSLHVKPETSRFVLPLCTSINMNGCAAFIFVTVIYLMQNHGIVISLPTMALWVIIATIAAIGNAGVPMGCFFLSASLLASMNVPITLLGIILPFYTLIDMLETALNVWSDACVTKVVDKHQNGLIATDITMSDLPLQV